MKTKESCLKSKFTTKLLIFIGICSALGIFYSKPILQSISRALVHQDSLTTTDAIVVLAGSSTGNRIKEAARLYHEGFANKLVFSGFQIYPGTHSSTLMKTYAQKLGVPENNILTKNTDEDVSTQGESLANLKLLEEQQIKSFILVTSSFHTRRAQLIYERSISLLGYDIKLLVSPAKDPIAPIDSWWNLRTGKKMIFLEYIKSVAYYFKL
jgi:uncharacterized SAM-binding protein YcdF (DUF218 family)